MGFIFQVVKKDRSLDELWLNNESKFKFGFMLLILFTIDSSFSLFSKVYVFHEYVVHFIFYELWWILFYYYYYYILCHSQHSIYEKKHFKRLCNQKRREPRRQSDSSFHYPSMSTSGLSYKPTRVHTHTTQRPNTGALLAELRDRIASQHESSTHSAKRVHSHKTTKTKSNAIPHSKSDMYILLRQHKRPHPLCCPKIYQCCGTTWASSKQKPGSSWLSIAAKEKTTTSLNFLQNPLLYPSFSPT